MARRLDDLSPGLFDVPLATPGVGALMGVVSFVFAMAATPQQSANYHDYNRLLVQNLGTLFPLLLGFWSGYVQQSLRAMLVGLGVGAMIAGLHRSFCGDSLLVGMLVSPILLSGVAAVGLGRGRRSWGERLGVRFLKGLLIGLGPWFVGILYFETTSDVVRAMKPALSQYRQLLWSSGTIGAAILGAIYLVLYHWAAGLKHLGWGTRVTLYASYRDTEGLDRVSGDPQRVWKDIERRLSQTDSNYRRVNRRYAGLVFALSVMLVAGTLNDSWLQQTVALPPPLHLAVSSVIGSMFPFLLLMWLLQAWRQTWINAKVAEELKKYPDGVPPPANRQESPRGSQSE